MTPRNQAYSSAKRTDRGCALTEASRKSEWGKFQSRGTSVTRIAASGPSIAMKQAFRVR